MAKLYDILFDPTDGEIAFGAHNHHIGISHEKWIKLRNITKKCAVNVYTNDAKTNNVDPEEKQELYRYFGLIFTEDRNHNNFAFVHSSIWQYLCAEALFEQFIDNADIDGNIIWERICQLVKTNFKIDKGIIDYIIHFISKTNKKDAFYLFLRTIILACPSKFDAIGDSLFNGLANVWALFFSVFTALCRKYYPEQLERFFKDINGIELTTFRRYTLLTDKCPVDDFVGYSFDDTDCGYTNLSFSYLYGVRMRNASFKSANFSHSVLKAAYACNSDFSGADFSFANMKNADFTNCNFCAANLSNSNLNGAFFTNAILDGADLRKSTLVKTRFNDSKLFHCVIDVNQMNIFGLDLIFENHMRVYDGDNELTRKEILNTFKELFKVEFAFWEHGINLKYHDLI